MTQTAAIQITAIAIAIIGGLCILALHAERVRQLMLQLFQIVYLPFIRLNAFFAQVFSSVIGWIKNQIRLENNRNETHHAVYYIVGCILYMALTALFVYCDLGLAIQSIEALGFASTLQIIEPASVMAVSMIAAPFAWGLIFFDAVGMTHLAPAFTHLGSIWKKTLIGISLLFFIVSVFSLLSLTFMRAWVIQKSAFADSTAVTAISESVEVTDADLNGESAGQVQASVDQPPGWVIYAALMLSGLSIIVCTMVCGAACLPLVKWLILGLGMILIVPFLPIWAVSAIIALIVNIISGFFMNLLELLISMGNSILNLFPGYRSRRTAVSENNNPADNPQVAAEKRTTDTQTPPEEGVKTSNMGFDPFGA